MGSEQVTTDTVRPLLLPSFHFILFFSFRLLALYLPPLKPEQVMVPDNMVGLIIGRGGEQITRLQAESGCKIQMSQDSQGMPHRLCTLTGSPEAISVARNLIDNIIANEGTRGGRGGGGGGGPMGGDFGGGPGYEMMVPGHLVARIIGKGGETIKALQEETGAKIVIIQDSKVCLVSLLYKASFVRHYIGFVLFLMCHSPHA